MLAASALAAASAHGAASNEAPVGLAPGAGAPAVSAPAAVGPSSMDKYMVIIDKKVFREIEVPDPPSAQTSASPTSATAAFGKDYELKALIDTGAGIRAGFFDKNAKENFYISEGGFHKGMQLVSVNYDEEEAVLRMGTDTCSFSLRPDKKPKPAAASAATPGAPPPLAMARPPGAMPPGAPFKPDPGKAEYRGKTIEQFLRDHPEAARQANSPIRMSAPNFKAFGKGMSIDQFLKEHPDAMSQFPHAHPARPVRRRRNQQGRSD